MIAKSLLLSLGNLITDGIIMSMSGDGKVTLDLDVKPGIVVNEGDPETGTIVARALDVLSDGTDTTWSGDPLSLIYVWRAPGSEAELNSYSPPLVGDPGIIVRSKYFIPYSASGSTDSDSGLDSYVEVSKCYNNKISISTEYNIPLIIRTSSGNYYPVEKGSLHKNQSQWDIDITRYLAYDNVPTFTGVWGIFTAGGAGRYNAAPPAMPIGSVYASMGAEPPVGTYLLNGQTIFGCNELYPKFWAWVNTAGVRSIDNDTFEAELAKYGICGGFVIDSANGSVRLPKWKYQAQLGETLPVRGNGLVLGLTNGTDNVGVQRIAGSQSFFFGPSIGAYGQPVGSQTESMAIRTGSFGVTTDPDNSGIVAENNAPEDHFVLCIQVFNTANALSEQESAQLASQMQMKAQTDLANVNSNIDFVVESWTNGAGGWYRKYRSGWVEQGGYSRVNTGVHTITLWVEMADANYAAISSFSMTGTSTDTDGAQTCPIVSDRTVTTIRLNQNKRTGDNSYWEVKGYAATE